MQIRKEEVKLSLFADYMTLYTENPNMTLYTENPNMLPKKLLELISKFGKVGGHKINIHIYILHVFTLTTI